MTLTLSQWIEAGNNKQETIKFSKDISLEQGILWDKTEKGR